jgi:Leucine-rich repeat (LRR) protein
MKFRSELKNFLQKFELSDEAKQELIKENTEIGYKGLGRVRAAKKGFILNLSLKNLNEIPSSICKLSKLESLEISYCKLENYPEPCPNLLSLKKLVFSNNQLDNLPSWVIEFASKNKTTKF